MRTKGGGGEVSIKADSDSDVKPIVDLAFGAIIHRIRKAGTRSGYRSSVPVGIGIDIGIGIGYCVPMPTPVSICPRFLTAHHRPYFL